MSLVDKRLNAIRDLKERRERGKMNLIPFYKHFPRLSKVIPGLFRQGIYKILSGTGEYTPFYIVKYSRTPNLSNEGLKIG